jgi:parvulin-like peptidyl-prolyl isomerase
MKFSAYLVFLSFLPFSTGFAAESTDDDILAERGKGIVTQQSFTARANKIPESDRLSTLRDGNRLKDVINTLLLRAQLAADAREAGYSNEEIVKERMRLAAEAELGSAWLEHYVATQPAADYEALARENYQLNKDRMLSSPKIDVSHILISTGERSVEESQELAESIAAKLKQDPELFDQLVMEYSEDPSVSANKGKFTGVKKGDMVKQFETVAFAMTEGEISTPVETMYGFHIIRLDAHIPPTKMEFDEVKAQLIKSERKRHEARIQNDYLNGLTSLDVKMTKEALEEMVRRQFGEDYKEFDETGSEAQQEDK